MSVELKLSILSPERKLVDSLSVEEVTLTGSEGQIQILPGHVPMIGTMTTGMFVYRAHGKDAVLGVISNGFFQIQDDGVRVLAETVELSGEIDLDRAKRAQTLSEETLQAADLDPQHYRKYQLKLQRALIRQQIAGHNF